MSDERAIGRDTSVALKLGYPVLATTYLLLIFGLPLVAAIAPILLASDVISKLIAALCCPIVFAVAFGLTAGILSLPHQKGIIAGKFPRQVGHPIYFHRRLYGLCWTALYYFVPVYFAFLSVPMLRRWLLRLFGYRGSLTFTTYPDTWMRDLPLLRLGSGVYLSNKATIGTNIVLANGPILVDEIILEDGVCVGHLSMLGPGVHLGKGVEVGVGVAIGIKTTVGEDSRVGPGCSIEHGVRIGANTKVGACCYIGSGSRIAGNLTIPPGSVIPPRSVLACPQDVVRHGEARRHVHRRVAENEPRLRHEPWGDASIEKLGRADMSGSDPLTTD